MAENLSDLLSAEAVRDRCGRIGVAAESGNTRWFIFHQSALSDCIEIVAKECLTNYPDLEIPFHSRWRHFSVDGTDLWQHYRSKHLPNSSRDSITRTAIDLVFVSVLLDAGAGDRWRFTDSVSGKVLSRSEGLAAASLQLFFNGLAETDAKGEFGISPEVLRRCSEQYLSSVFQHRPDNPLVGIPGRSRLLQGLADTLEATQSRNFHRPGNLYDHLCEKYPGRSLPAGELLRTVLRFFNAMWPDGMIQDGIHLGDCGKYDLPGNTTSNENIVPFHKLSQWLTYSLLEPLQWAGVEITDLDQLTGLPEYRNGGLLLDSGVLTLRDPSVADHALKVSSETVVEWRALTVWLLDKIAQGVRDKLGKNNQSLPLASVLQGGTWSAGRKLASEKRGGLPPLILDIQGTVF